MRRFAGSALVNRMKGCLKPRPYMCLFGVFQVTCVIEEVDSVAVWHWLITSRASIAVTLVEVNSAERSVPF